MSNVPFNPLMNLKQKKTANPQKGVKIRMNRAVPIKPRNYEEKKEDDESLDIGAVDTEAIELEEEVVEMPEKTGVIIVDERKQNKIDYDLIRARLLENHLFGVNVQIPMKDLTKPTLPAAPIEVAVEEEVVQIPGVEEVPLQELAEEEVVQKPAIAPKKTIPKKRKLNIIEKPVDAAELNAVVIPPIAPQEKVVKPAKALPEKEELPVIELPTKALPKKALPPTKAKLGKDIFVDRMPTREQIKMKVSPYYLNNRKLFIEKLIHLLAPYRKEILENNETISCDFRSESKEFELLTHQKVVRDYLNLYTPYRGLLLYFGLGAGKCHKKDTPIMMSDGSIKMVQDIKVGEFLMGDDSKPRTVESLAQGRDEMYEIIPIKGESYIVNKEHILCLKATGYPKISFHTGRTSANYCVQWIENNEFKTKTFLFNDANQSLIEQKSRHFFDEIRLNENTNQNILEIAVKDYIHLSKKTKGLLKGYKVPVEFPEKEVPVDPYAIGYWLGQDSKTTEEETTEEETTEEETHELFAALKQFSMDGENKHIPMIYKCNSRENRFKLLAGIIDTCGRFDKQGFEIIHSNPTVINDIMYLSRSIGLACFTKKGQTSIHISGEGIEEIPVRNVQSRAEPRKQIKNVLETEIEVKYVNEDDYYGFTLDGNCRYLMGDFTVTHNTCASIAIAEGMKSEKKIILMTPASLKMNFFGELKKCGDRLFRKDQFWEFIPIDGNPQYLNALSNSLGLSTEIISEQGGAWMVNITKPSNFSELNPKNQKQIDDQLNLMIRSKYRDYNYNGLTQKKMDELTENNTINPFDHSVVIVDEAHNFVGRIINKLKKPESKSYKLYHFLMSAIDVRIVFLSGTPIINYPNEIGVLYNILRGYIRTWTIPLTVKTSKKIDRDAILEMLDENDLNTYDYVEYSGNNLTITRNPFGFVNAKKPGVPKGTRAIKGGKKTRRQLKSTVRKTKNQRTRLYNLEHPRIASNEIDEFNHPYVKTADNVIIPQHTTDVELPYNATIEYHDTLNNDPHMGGASNVFDKYAGVRLDVKGNISDAEFEKRLVDILKKNQLEPVGKKIQSVNLTALPDNKDMFIDTFIGSSPEENYGNVKNLDAFKRRILGLTSYFRSAQEQLLPQFVKTDDGETYHQINVPMSDYQFGVYYKIRKEERDQERAAKKRKAIAAARLDDLYNIASSYRIFSRAACNFAFPASRPRPLPGKGEEEEQIDENVLDAVPIEVQKMSETYEEDDEENEEDQQKTEKQIQLDRKSQYQKDIIDAMDFLKYDKLNPRTEEYLTADALLTYSPKFAKILENLLNPEYPGLHLLYSQFRTIEGIGILKLILEANGFAEFKITATSNGGWNIVEKEGDEDKPKFVLYTGTETELEKKMILNIYNGNWKEVSPILVERFKKKAENNNLGDIIKIMMITSSGAEGINLRNTRYVHVVEPYWNMVRIEQVVGRARRICSHQDLPDELKTVQVFLYVSTFTPEQISNEEYRELILNDLSKLDNKTPLSTDQSLLEIANIKNNTNRQILTAIKESSIDCTLYNNNPDEPLVCYGFGQVESNNFSSYPTLERDISEKMEMNVKTITWVGQEITIDGKQYAMNKRTYKIYTLENYLRAKQTGDVLIEVGKYDPVKKMVFWK